MGEGIVIDTGVIIAHLRAAGKTKTSFQEAIERYPKCYISSITAWEIEYGACRAGRPSDLTDILGLVKVLPFDLEDARIAAKVHAELKSRNQEIGIRDVFIAGTCLANGLPLLTANVKHFRRVSNLEVIQP